MSSCIPVGVELLSLGMDIWVFRKMYQSCTKEDSRGQTFFRKISTRKVSVSIYLMCAWITAIFTKSITLVTFNHLTDRMLQTLFAQRTDGVFILTLVYVCVLHWYILYLFPFLVASTVLCNCSPFSSNRGGGLQTEDVYFKSSDPTIQIGVEVPWDLVKPVTSRVKWYSKTQVVVFLCLVGCQLYGTFGRIEMNQWKKCIAHEV